MHYQGIIGLTVLIGVAWSLSENRKHINYKGVAAGITLQLIIAAVLLNVPVFRTFFCS